MDGPNRLASSRNTKTALGDKNKPLVSFSQQQVAIATTHNVDHENDDDVMLLVQSFPVAEPSSRKAALRFNLDEILAKKLRENK